MHAVKSARMSKLALENGLVKTVQRVKSGLAIVPKNPQDTETLTAKAQDISTVLGGTVEKAEQWMTYVVDYIPRNLRSIDGSN